MTTKKTNLSMVTVALFVATFMTAIEGTIVSTAMPTIISSLKGLNLMSWVFSIYLLTSSIATPIYGKLSDQFGRKKIFMFGLTVFILGSCLAGASQSILFLILARALQGIGAGAIQPLTFIIIADLYSFDKRPKVLGLNSAGWGIASILAPLLGGYIVKYWSWHWVFLINLPVGLITLLVIGLFFHEKPRHNTAKVDVTGTLWLSLTLFMILLVAQNLNNLRNWPILAGSILIVAVSVWRFIKTEQHVVNPLIPLHLFRNQVFVGHNGVAAAVSGALIAFEVYLPMWVQGVLGLSPTMGGYAVTPSSVMWILGSFWTGRLLAKQAPHRILVGALGLLLVGYSCLHFLPMTTPFFIFLLVAGMMGMGFGLIITTTTVTVQQAVVEQEVGIATSLNMLSRTLGQTIMMSVFGLVQNMYFQRAASRKQGMSLSRFNQLIDPETAHLVPQKLLEPMRAVLLQAFHGIYLLALGLILLAFIANVYATRRRPVKSTR